MEGKPRAGLVLRRSNPSAPGRALRKSRSAGRRPALPEMPEPEEAPGEWAHPTRQAVHLAESTARTSNVLASTFSVPVATSQVQRLTVGALHRFVRLSIAK